ncbi:MAG: hypothetical protein AAF721_41800 [Myxococcota bacterium]
MNAARWLAVGCLGAVACAPATSDPTTPSAAMPRPPAGAPNAERGASTGCVPSEPAERLTLSVNSAADVASGLQVHFVGSSQDHYDDGRFDIIAEFAFRWGEQSDTAIVSTLAEPTWKSVLSHCWRFVALDDEGAALEVSPAVAGPTLGPCDAPSGLAEFDSYYDVAPGKRFAATLTYDDDGHAWSVSPTPKILHHHATRIEWDNLAAVGRTGLGAARGRPVRAVFVFSDSKVVQVEPRRWNSTHHATLESVCLP